MAGIGKTQLATRFALNHLDDYRVIWNIQAESEATATLDLSNLAVALELTGEDDDIRQKLSKLHNWLAKNNDWLLVFDNAQHLDILKVAFPTGGPVLGKVLITSVKGDWGNSVTEIPLDVWSGAEAVAFLEKRLNAGKYRSKDELAELAKLLGWLPLALEQAAAYINSTPTVLREYIDLFQARRRELWGDTKHEQPPSDYHETVATTWSISIQKIEEMSAGALALLQVCSLFAPNDIPLSLLERGKDMLPGPLPTILGDPLARNQATAALRDYSLISLENLNDEDTLISVHKLVQDVVRDRMPEHDSFLEAILKLQLGAFPFDKERRETWWISDVLSQHMLVSAQLAKNTSVDKMLMTTTINNAANLLSVKGQLLDSDNLHQKAEALYTEILKIREDHFRDQPGSIAVVLSGLAGVRRVRVQARSKAFFSSYQKTTRNTTEDVDSLLKEIEHVEKAFEDVLALYERARALSEEQFGNDSEEYAYRISGLGSIYVDLAAASAREGLLEEAEQLQLNAISIVETKIKNDELSEEELTFYLKNLARTQLYSAKPYGAKDSLSKLQRLVDKYLPPTCLAAASLHEYLGYVALSPYVNAVERWAAPKHFRKARTIYMELRYQEKYLLNTFNLVNGLMACGQEEAAERHQRYIPPDQFFSFLEHFTYHTEGVDVGLLKKIREGLKASSQ